ASSTSGNSFFSGTAIIMGPSSGMVFSESNGRFYFNTAFGLAPLQGYGDYSLTFDSLSGQIFSQENPKIYEGIFQQTDTNAPTFTPLVNTLGTIVWSYVDVGIYTGVLANAFDNVVTLHITPNDPTLKIGYSILDGDTIQITVLDSSDSPSNIDGECSLIIKA